MKASEEVERLVKKLNDGSLHPDEPLFVIRGRDTAASSAVMIWSIIAKLAGASDEKVAGGMKIANKMEDWPVKQTAGRSETRPGEEPPNTDD